MSRYTYIHTQIWKDKKFRQLSDNSKLLYIAMLTAPNSNMIGLYEWPSAYAAHDLGDWSMDKFFACINEIEAQGMAFYDRDNEIVFIPSFLKYNPLNNIKQITGGANYFNTISGTPLFSKFLDVWTEYVDKPFRNRLAGRNDESALKALNSVDKILAGIRARIADLGSYRVVEVTNIIEPAKNEAEEVMGDTVLNEYAEQSDEVSISNEYPIDTLPIIPVPVHVHGQVQVQKDKKIPVSVKTDTSVAGSEKHATLNQVLAIWNEILAPLNFPKALKSTPARERAFKARLNALSDRLKLEWWQEIFKRLASSEFMLKSAKNKANWLTFDWLLNENNLVKVQEGKYDNKPDVPKREPPHTYEEAMERYNRKRSNVPQSYDEAIERYQRKFQGDFIDVEASEVAESGLVA